MSNVDDLIVITQFMLATAGTLAALVSRRLLSHGDVGSSVAAIIVAMTLLGFAVVMGGLT